MLSQGQPGDSLHPSKGETSGQRHGGRHPSTPSVGRLRGTSAANSMQRSTGSPQAASRSTLKGRAASSNRSDSMKPGQIAVQRMHLKDLQAACIAMRDGCTAMQSVFNDVLDAQRI